MTEERVRDALSIFREACELPPAERDGFLDTACGDDADLRREVESMLAWDDSDDEATMESDTHRPVREVLSNLARETETGSLPESIGGYRIVKLIARGGMGVVYEALQQNPERRVALKLARDGGTTTERARRFELEAQLLARLRHPGIAQIIEAGTTPADEGARPYFVMELVEGESVKDHAATHLPFARQKLELMARVCEAVGFAHENGVIHRDLKPDNVLIEEGGAPKVLDFGVAKVQEAGGFGAATLRTEEGRVIGTMGYMAPEQLQGQTEGLGPQADVYSLGVMIYELLTGHLPHDLEAATITRALAVVTSTDAPLLGVIRPEYRGDIEAVVAKALEKDPRHRYADASELQADLARYLRGEPTLARPAGPLLKTVKWTRRNPALTTSLAGLFLAVSAVAVVLFVMNQEVVAALTDNERLLDARRVKQAAADADELWPTYGKAEALRSWLRDNRALVGRIEVHRAELERRRASGLSTRELEKLVHDLQALQRDDALFAHVEARLAFAETVEEKTVTSRRADWDAAIERIRENPDYGRLSGELTLEPQVGLVPLGPDPETGLEEFLHLETHAGDLPPAGKGERTPLEVGAETGLVFVLIPGGTFCLGAQNEHPDKPGYDPNASTGSGVEEGPVDPNARVEAFFLSKYEMTQAQWERVAGWNLSYIKAPTKPVTDVSWLDCDEVTRRLRLILPTEKQWEYATRAGMDTPFWTGETAESMEGCENLFDLNDAEDLPDWVGLNFVTPAPWRDELKRNRPNSDRGPMPVGSYLPNNFGLYDVAGNVSEWCADNHFGRTGPMEKEGLRRVRTARGSSYMNGVELARSSAHRHTGVGFSNPRLGLRPAMEIRRSR